VARASRDVMRRATEEEERACNTSLPKLPIASEGESLIKRSQLLSTSKVVLNFSTTCHLPTWTLEINQELLSYMGLNLFIIQQPPL